MSAGKRLGWSISFLLVFVMSAGPLVGDDRPPHAYVTDPDAAVARLLELAVRDEENLGRIRTWSGSYDYHDRQLVMKNVAADGVTPVDPPVTDEAQTPEDAYERVPFRKVEDGVITFSLDVANNCYSMEMRSSDSATVNRADDNRAYASSLIPYHEMMFNRNGEVARFSPLLRYTFELDLPLLSSPAGARFDRSETGFVEKVRRVKRGGEDLLQGESVSSSMFSPLELFYQEGIPTHQRLRMYAKAIEDDPSLLDSDIRIAEQGEQVTVSATYHGPDPSETIVAEWSFDDSSGWLKARRSEVVVTGDGSRTLSDMTEWTYAKEDSNGIRVPQSVHLASYDDHGALTFDRTLTLVSSVVNTPVASDDFTLAQFPLEDGDRILGGEPGDTRVFYDAQLLSPADYASQLAESLSSSGKVTPQGHGWTLFYFNAFLISLVCIVLAWRTIRQGKPAGDNASGSQG
ncbi:hypothetical protein Mal4_00430 [Maioricimonas rarisocia]|uniref:Uncharacterized protein n=1 Tax=Maioricimonas rarisocia TaxID=2528026 RepID=A0A517YZV3_9PLAN|nr:hypothetical protein [Maioricimonas rarisocia]QDU35761.1 hypothetical protein Mal4_00430 [Maioricimonas rarisocia]